MVFSGFTKSLGSIYISGKFSTWKLAVHQAFGSDFKKVVLQNYTHSTYESCGINE